MSINIPQIDLTAPTDLKTASFAMNCFWGPDGLFGCMPGVVRTRVGYAGGATDNPTYHHIGDYLETIQLDYDPNALVYEELLTIFWNEHNPCAKHVKRQYNSAIFYHNEAQQQAAKQSIEKKGMAIELLPANTFYLAESYHQKYRLRQDSRLYVEFAAIYLDDLELMNSTAAARVNGYLGGFGNALQFEREKNLLGLSNAGKDWLTLIVKQYNE